MKGENNPMKRSEVSRKVSAILKGYHTSPSTEFKKGIVPWNKGKIGIYSEETKTKMIKASRDATCIRPNKSERQLLALLDRIALNQFKYVGNGQAVLGGKIPDFININGKKQIIEFFGQYWHSEKKKNHSKQEEEQQRIDHFAKYGYSTLIIWENELKDLPTLEAKITAFAEGNQQ